MQTLFLSSLNRINFDQFLCELSLCIAFQRSFINSRIVNVFFCLKVMRCLFLLTSSACCRKSEFTILLLTISLLSLSFRLGFSCTCFHWVRIQKDFWFSYWIICFIERSVFKLQTRTSLSVSAQEKWPQATQETWSLGIYKKYKVLISDSFETRMEIDWRLFLTKMFDSW